MKQLKKYYILLAVLFASGCELEKEIDYDDLENYVPKIIVHGTINQKNGVNVIVKKTTSPSKVDDNDILSDLAVFLHKSETDSIELTQKSDYLFSLDSLPYLKPNQQYQLKVTANNFDNIYSNNQEVLPPPVIDSILLIDTSPKRLMIYFKNKYEEKRAYYVKTFPYLNGSIDTSYDKGVLFFDILKNISTGANAVEQNINHFSSADSLLVELHLISKDLEEFAKSERKYEGSEGDPFYPQPFLMYSNITGGYGIFAAHSYSSFIYND